MLHIFLTEEYRSIFKRKSRSKSFKKHFLCDAWKLHPHHSLMLMGVVRLTPENLLLSLQDGGAMLTFTGPLPNSEHWNWARIIKPHASEHKLITSDLGKEIFPPNIAHLAYYIINILFFEARSTGHCQKCDSRYLRLREEPVFLNIWRKFAMLIGGNSPEWLLYSFYSSSLPLIASMTSPYCSPINDWLSTITHPFPQFWPMTKVLGWLIVAMLV